MYLRAQLQEEAARVISGFPLTNDTYMPSINLLRNRFAKPDKLKKAHMQALIDLPKPSNTLTSLQQFHTSVESHTTPKALPHWERTVTPMVICLYP